MGSEVGLGNCPQHPTPASVVLEGVSDTSGLGLTSDTWGTNKLNASIIEWTQGAPPKSVSCGSLESQAVLSDGLIHSFDHRSLCTSQRFQAGNRGTWPHPLGT